MGNIPRDCDNLLEEGGAHIIRIVYSDFKVYSYKTNTGRIEMKLKGMKQNRYTENILDLNETTGELKGTGKKLDFIQLMQVLDGADPQQQVIYPEFLRKNGRFQQMTTIHLAKFSKLVYAKRIMLADFLTIPFGTEKDDVEEWCKDSHTKIYIKQNKTKIKNARNI